MKYVLGVLLIIILGIGGCIEFIEGGWSLYLGRYFPPENGPYVLKHKDGNMVIEGHYLDGKKHGKFYEYFNNGSMKESRNFAHGIEVDTTLQYYQGDGKGENGFIKERQIFDENGEKHGKWMSRRARRHDEPYWIENWKHGEKHGKHVEFYWEKIKKPGLPGLWSQEKKQEFFVDGFTDSTYTWWHENGQIAEKAYYIDGYRHGVWEYFDADGNLTDRDVWEKHKCVEDCEGPCARGSGMGGMSSRDRSVNNCEPTINTTFGDRPHTDCTWPPCE